MDFSLSSYSYLGGTQVAYEARLTLTAVAALGVDTGRPVQTWVLKRALIDVLHTVAGVGPP